MVAWILCLFCLSLWAVADAQNQTRDIAAVVESSGFSTMIQLMVQAGLKQSLMQQGPFTLFAPTNDAFRDLDQRLVQDMLLGKHDLREVLLYHIVSGEVVSDQLLHGSSVPTLAGKSIFFTVEPPNVIANDANIVEFDVLASNGVIHVVDKVLIPLDKENLVLKPQGAPLANSLVEVIDGEGLNVMSQLLSDAGLAATFSSAGPYTLLAPTDEAFSRMNSSLRQQLGEDGDTLRNVLLYHVIPGNLFFSHLTHDLLKKTVQGERIRIHKFTAKEKKITMVNGANFLATDKGASNGIVHVIDEVLIPPGGDVIDVLSRNPDFSLLVDAVTEAGLKEFLRTDSSLTVLAPNNKAFLNMNEGDLEKAMKQKGLMSEMVLRHIILGINHGPLYSAALCWDSLRTANNIMLKTGVGINGTMKIASPFGRTTVMKKDMVASNGVIHEIDAML